MHLPDLPGLPRDAAGAPVFPGAWQARAFALALRLNEAGLFTWPRFTAALAAALREEPDYWRAWVSALGSVTAGFAAPAAVAQVAARWTRAAALTPHGSPIRLENADDANSLP